MSSWTENQQMYLPALQAQADFEVTGAFQKGYKGTGGGKVFTLNTLSAAKSNFRKLFETGVGIRKQGAAAVSWVKQIWDREGLISTTKSPATPFEGGQRGMASLGMLVVLAITAVLLTSKDARSFAASMAIEGAAQHIASKFVGPKLGFGVTLLLGFCSDQAGTCENEGSERVINNRIAKEFPAAYHSPNRCVPGIGWPCIEVFTGHEIGPGYAEAREKVLVEFQREAEQKREAEQREVYQRTCHAQSHRAWLLQVTGHSSLGRAARAQRHGRRRLGRPRRLVRPRGPGQAR